MNKKRVPASSLFIPSAIKKAAGSLTWLRAAACAEIAKPIWEDLFPFNYKRI